MIDGANVVTEEVGVADLGSLYTAGVVAVAEQHQFHRRAKPEGDDGQVDASGSHRRQPEQQAQRHRCGDSSDQPE